MLPAVRSRRQWVWRGASGAALVVVLASAGVLLAPLFRKSTGPAKLEYVQLTNFADSAVSPALSPDGRMLAFVRGPSTTMLMGPGQVYVKQLPDGKPVELTHDRLDKMDPRFSPDGARITYSATDPAAFSTMDTWVVRVLGGQPQRLLTNATGLTWVQTNTGTAHPSRVLFSELEATGMSIVTSTESCGASVRLADQLMLAVRAPIGNLCHTLYANATAARARCRLGTSA